MAKGYILAQVSIPDEAAYRESGYMAMAEAAVAAFNGRFLIRGGNPATLEGAPGTSRIVVLEFPSRDAAAAFHASVEYASAIELRQSLSTGTLTLLSGYDPT